MSPGSHFPCRRAKSRGLRIRTTPRLISCHRHAPHRLADHIEKGKARQPRTPPYPLLPTLSSLLWKPTAFFKGRGKRDERGVHGHFAVGFRYGSHGDPAVRGAPKRASHALPSSPYSPFPTSFIGRAAEAPRGRAQARQPRTPLFSLLSLPYFPHLIEGTVSVSDMRVVP